MPSAYNKFNDFSEQLLRGTHNFGANVFKAVFIAAANAPVATNTVLANLTHLATGGGYTGGAGGGVTLDGVTLSRTGATTKLVITDELFTATGAAVGPFRYVAVYNDTAASDNLVGWYDYGSDITLQDGEPFTIDFDGTNGVFTLG